MNATTLIAIVGAGAWVPQVFSWIKSCLSKPKLRFVPQEITQIGYTVFWGPIFSQNFAISVWRKDALVEKITATVIHKGGARHNFYWKYLSEKGAEIRGVSGEIAEFSKNQPAIALKVSILGLSEKTIVFQDLEYVRNLVMLLARQGEKENYLEKASVPNYQQEVIKSKEFLDIQDFVKTDFYWQQGKYDVYLYVHETSLKKPHVEHFRFELSKSDVEQLEKNIKEIQEYFKDVVLYKGKKPEEWPRHFWNWVTPGFYRAEEGKLSKGK